MIPDLVDNLRSLRPHPWGAFALDCAARTGTPTERYNDLGQWAAPTVELRSSVEVIPA